MKTTVRIPSKLYRHLYTEGGDKLLAVFCILKAFKGQDIKYYAYKAKNNKTVGGYGLLRDKTNLSLHVINKYVPKLISMDLCYIDNNGDFIMVGNNKLKTIYNKKLVPIKIGAIFAETAINTISVRLHSESKQQQFQIRKKHNRSDLLKQLDNPKSLKEYKAAKRIVKKYSDSDFTVNDKIVLSNQGFAVVKDGTVDNKSKGAYWKRKLRSKGVVKTTRIFSRIKRLSYSEYICLKSSRVLDRNITFKSGWLVEETVSSFTPTDLIGNTVVLPTQKPIIVKPLAYLQFDMIAFWSNL